MNRAARNLLLAQKPDPLAKNVVLLCNWNGVDGAAAAKDESKSPKALTFTGNAQIDTSKFRLGHSSLLLDGNGDRVSAADSSDFDLSNSQFCVELFINPNSVTGTRFLVGQWQAAPTLGWMLNLNGSTPRLNLSTTGSDNLVDLTGGTIVIGAWQHLAMSFDGSKYRMFIEGRMTASSTTLRTIFNSTSVLSIGSNATPDGFYYDGWVGPLRITKGTGAGRYVSDGGFRVPTLPFRL